MYFHQILNNLQIVAVSKIMYLINLIFERAQRYDYSLPTDPTNP